MNRVAGGLAVVVCLPLASAPTAEAASVPPTPSPATVLTLAPVPGTGSAQLQGSLCQDGNTCVPITYTGVTDGVINLNNALTSTSATHIIVLGYSNGAEVAEQWVVQHASAANAPSQQVLSFVVVGNPTRAGNGVNAITLGEVWPQSQYKVIDVARQYDGVADFPNNPSSQYYWLAVWNADAGFASGLHDYTNVNINDPANAVWTVGNITYVLVPTQTLPLLIPAQALGINVDALNAQLKPLVEQAYIRPAPFPTTTQRASPTTSTAGASPLSTSVVSNPTAAPQHTTVALSLAPAPPAATTGSAPTATVTTTPPAGRANVVGPVKTITPPAAQPGLTNAVAANKSTTAPTTNTSTSTTNRNNVVTGNASGTR